MKRLLLASTACLGWAVAAQAADLPARAMAPVVAIPPAFTWTGFYVGANAGYAFETRRRDGNVFFGGPQQLVIPPGAANYGFNNIAALPVTPNAFAGGVLTIGNGNNGLFNNNRGRRDGFTGGGQVGYNWQLTPGAGLVIGFEADAQFADLNRRSDTELFGFGNGVGGFGFGGNTVVNGTPVGVQVGGPLANIAGPVLVQGGANTGAVGSFFIERGNVPAGTGIINAAVLPAGLTAAQNIANAGGTVAAVTPAVVGTPAFGFNVITPAGTGILAAGQGGSVTFIDPFRNANNNQRGIDWFGTVRGRLGYGFNRALLYVTGGLAYGGSDRNDHFANGFGSTFGGVGGFGLGGNCTGLNNCNDRIRLGWTAGAGLEYAFTDQWSFKLEGLYVSLDDRRNNNGVFGIPANAPVPYARDAAGNTYFAPAGAFTNQNNGFFNNRNATDFAVVRVGLNYHFNFMAPTPAPVVARY